MPTPSVSLAGITIHEPATVITDLLITILCLYVFGRVRHRDWRYFFFFLGLSTLAGAVSHAFFGIHEGPAYKSVWLSMQLLSVISVYFAGKAAAPLLGVKGERIFKYVVSIQVLVFMTAVFVFQHFLVVVADNAAGLIPVMIICYLKGRPHHRMIGHGILFSFLTVFVHTFKLSPSIWFNHNDVAHLFIMVSVWLMYRGARKTSLTGKETV